MDTEIEVPPVPKVKLDKVEAHYKQVESRIRRTYGTFRLTAGMCVALAEVIYPLLGKHFNRGHVMSIAQSLSAYLDRTLDEALVRTLSRQLVGRWEELLTGPLVPYGDALISEWVPLEVLGVEAGVWKSGLPASTLALQALYGRPAGHIFQKKVPDSWLRGFAYSIGYSRRIVYPDEPKQLLGLKFWSYMQPSPDSPDGIQLLSWGMDPRLKTENLTIIRRRNRVDLDLDELDKEGEPRKWACPGNYEHDCRSCTRTSTYCNASYLRD
jgi:hypothetical protein